MALIWAALLAGAASASATELLYYGGPVSHSMNVVLVEWGAHVRSTYINPTSGDPGLFKYLSSQDGSTSDIGGVLAQYMDNTGHNSQNRFSFVKAVQVTPTVAPTPPGKVFDADIQAELARDINAHTLPGPTGGGLTSIYVVLFPPGDDVCFDGGGCAYDSGGFCAYHGSFQLTGTSTQVLYAAMSDNGPGSPNFGGCGVGASSDLGSQTSVVSHEVSETINDPLGSVASWYDFTDNGEIADLCDGEPLAANGPWTVESLWSDRDKGCAAGESAYRAPTASFLAPSAGTAGQQLSFNAASSSDPVADRTSALDQTSGKSYSIGSGIVRYSWNWGDGTPSTASTTAAATHTFAVAANYQVSLTVTDRLGFTSTRTQQVSVASSTPGAPVVVTRPATAPGSRTATLNGTINPEGHTVSYQFRYGTSVSSLTLATPLSAGPAGASPVAVSASVSGLTPSTTYYYELVVTTGGSTYVGAVESFQTTGSAPPRTPTVATGPAGRVGTTGAILTGMVNPDGLKVFYHFVYGSSASDLRTTPVTAGPTGRTAVPVSATVSNLAPATTYYFVLVVTVGSNRYKGSVQRFTTAWPKAGVVTGGTSDIASGSATVYGQINPHGTDTIYQAQFGPTTSYGFSTTWIDGGSGTSWEGVQLVLFGLHPSTTYHYRIVAQGSHGTEVGVDKTFTTAPAPAAAPRFELKISSHISWRRLLARTLAVRFRCSRACTAHFVLTVEPAGDDSRIIVLPVMIGQGRARLAHAGSARASLRLKRRFRRHLRRAASKRLRLTLSGYATSRNSRPSAPDVIRIRLTR